MSASRARRLGDVDTAISPIGGSALRAGRRCIDILARRMARLADECLQRHRDRLN
jgi:hypothetical protein